MLGRTSFFVILFVLTNCTIFYLFFYQQHDLFYIILSTELSSNLFLGNLSLIFLKSRFLGARIFQSNTRRVKLQLRDKESLVVYLGEVLRFNSSCSSKSVADNLAFGSTFKHSRMKSQRSLEYTPGTLLYTPPIIVFLSDFRSLLTKGGLNEAIQYSTHPKDQMSHFALYGLSSQTSGLAQQGVPVWVLAIPLAVTMDTFMSASLTCD